jgi:glycosyltransferase involved in cell wall biosynthesis
MKVLYLNPDRGIPVLGDKGASVHVREFITAAAELGHEVVLACATLGHGNPAPAGRIVCLEYNITDAELKAECRGLGLPITALSDLALRREVSRLAYDRTLPARVLAQLSNIGFRPELVYERHALLHRAGIHIARRLGVPRLIEVNAPLVDEQRRFRGLNLESEAKVAQEDSYRGANAIIAVSDAVATHVSEVLGSRQSVHVLPNGVNLARFGKHRGGAEIRMQLGIGKEPLLGFIGSFKPWHGMMFLLEVFRALLEIRPEIRLVAVGDGPELEAVRNRVSAWNLEDKVILPGRVPHADIPAWLDAMDVSIAPYLPHADFYFSPLKIIESMAAGRPVVAPRIGQIADLIDDQRTGRLYLPGDPVTCATALLDLIDIPKQRQLMGLAAERDAAKHSWSHVVEQALSLVQRQALDRAVAS